MSFTMWSLFNVRRISSPFFFFPLRSRLNRNKLQFLPELLFQSNPKLGRLWVHLSCFSIPPSSDFLKPLPSLLSDSLPSPTLSASLLMCYVIRFENTATVRCQNFHPQGWGFKSHARWHSAALCSCQEVKESVRVRCVWLCVCVCVCVCVCMSFKRWKCACSECFAWTWVEFLFGNIEFSQSIQSVRAGHTDAETTPTRSAPLSFSSHIPRLTLSRSSLRGFQSHLSSHPVLWFFPLRWRSISVFVLSSERLRQLRLKVETPSKLYVCLDWAAFK